MRPWPSVVPLSSADTRTEAAPVKWAGSCSCRPSSAASTCAGVPTKDTRASSLPSPATKTSPAVEASVSVPTPASSVTRSLTVAGSGSSTVIARLAAREKITGAPSTDSKAAGTPMRGASSTGDTVSVTWCEADFAGPKSPWPRSSTTSTSASLPP